MSVVQMCFFWCSGLYFYIFILYIYFYFFIFFKFYFIFQELSLKSLNHPPDPLLYCYSLMMFTQVGEDTKWAWKVGMSIFFKVSGDCGCTVFAEGPPAVPLAFRESACKDRKTGARHLCNGIACCRNARLEFS